MPTLDALMELPGALAAFEFRGSGELLDHRIDSSGLVDAKTVDLIAHVCAANLSIATMQARGWESTTGMEGFYPVKQVTLVGFDWSVVASGLAREAWKDSPEGAPPPFVGLVVANEAVDYDAVFAALEK